ncbi:MAG: hypothetical protein N2690_03535 [Rhodocyclaceae bacterium]|nr:hypothetical protein [Rhodocyclaceae bacterium]
MTLRPFALALSFLCLALPARAETIACPDLAAAVQVGACPSEEELRYTFTGFCSDNARIYNWQEEQVCTDYARYRRLKNVALWEAQGGQFQGYLSCDLAPAAIRAMKARRLAVTRQGKMTRLVCEYGENVVFAYRTKAICQVAGEGDCAAGGVCQARCD